MVVYIAPDALGLHHVLLKYNGTVPYTYSDFNGYGHFVAPLFWLNLYYMMGALLLAVLTNLLWVRGAETSAAPARALVWAALWHRGAAGAGRRGGWPCCW